MYEHITRIPKSPYMHYCTILWNLNAQNYHGTFTIALQLRCFMLNLTKLHNTIIFATRLYWPSPLL